MICGENYLFMYFKSPAAPNWFTRFSWKFKTRRILKSCLHQSNLNVRHPIQSIPETNLQFWNQILNIVGRLFTNLDRLQLTRNEPFLNKSLSAYIWKRQPKVFLLFYLIIIWNYVMIFYGQILFWTFEHIISLLKMFLAQMFGDKIDSKEAVRMSTRVLFTFQRLRNSRNENRIAKHKKRKCFGFSKGQVMGLSCRYGMFSETFTPWWRLFFQIQYYSLISEYIWGCFRRPSFTSWLK